METASTARAVFTYGPIAFIALSFVASAPLAKRLARRFGRARPPEETLWERPAVGERVISLLAAASVIWGAATAIGAGLLRLPDPRGPAKDLRFDLALFVHAIPPMSKPAAERIANELRSADDVTRFQPPAEMERRYVLAATLDPQPERAVTELAAHGFRTHAGRFALSSSSLATCDPGLDALAEALQGSALQDLMLRCRNAPGDGVGHAAFKMGDFERAVGSETESILSRMPRSPVNEPGCFAGGLEVPPPSQPICRLIHAEMVEKTRSEIYATQVPSPTFARLWWEAARATGDAAPLESARAEIDPDLLVGRSRVALRDQPIAILRKVVLARPAERRPRDVWTMLAYAAALSERADRSEASELVQQALDVAALAVSDDSERADVDRLALAIAIRAGDDDLAGALAERLPEGDPLVSRAAWKAGATTPPTRGTDPEWMRLAAAGANGAAIADALHRERDRIEDLGRLVVVPELQREPLREWVREDFPPCTRCDFADLLGRTVLRLDAARALGDDVLVEALGDVHRRYEAVILNRVLALSLRASEPP